MTQSHRSIVELFLSNAERYPDKTAAMAKQGGRYRDHTWRELAREVRTLAAGLIDIGVQPEDRVCLLSATRLEWITIDLAILSAGATTVGIYPSNLSDDCRYIAEDAGAVLVIAEDATQVDKFRAERERLPAVTRVIQMDGDVPAKDDWVISLAELKARGEKSADDDELKRRRDNLTPDSMLTIIYTSGTTGRPKGAVTTHGALIWEAEAIAAVELVRKDDVQFLFLPLAHSFARTLVNAWLGTQHVLAIAESLDTIQQNLGEVGPTVMCGVPRVFEKMYATVVQKADAMGGLRAKMFHAASAASVQHGEAEAAGRRLGFFGRLRFAFFKATVLRKVGRGLQEALGGRMRIMGSGSAPIAPKILWLFRDAGVLLLEGYGLTETSSGGSINRPDAYRVGTVGQVLPGMEAKLDSDGEVLLRGPNIMREYWKQPEATAAVLQDGWFRTGDIGEIDGDGYLRITDRKKDLIITAGGKNIAPQKIENLVKMDPLISQVVVHGDRRKYLSALITLDPEGLEALARERGLGVRDYAALCADEAVKREVDRIIAGFNRRLPSYETIKKFAILDHELSEESGELTPTLKVKRKVVGERYADILDRFYSESF